MAANEEGVREILLLDVGPIFRDLLGLTVVLSQIELDIDARPGDGKLGNLLRDPVNNLLG